MEERIRQRFGEHILAETAARYNLPTEALTRLGASESYIFAYTHEGQPRILRLGHSLRRSAALIHGEVDWMAYLHRHGVGVAQPVLSPSGALVEEIDDGQGGAFLATTFVAAPGGPPKQEKWNTTLFEEYGRVLGRMHRVTQSYTPPNLAWMRPQWDDPSMIDLVDFLPASEQLAREHWQRTLAAIRALPRGASTYGLVHQDAHSGNFFVDEAGRLTFFDFDDCVYSWFANDVAIVLFYAVSSEEDAEGFARQFLTHFLRGYVSETTLEPIWLEHFPLFLKLREIDLYGAIHRDFDVDNLTHPWVARYMRGRKERIDADRPYLDLNFGDFAHLLGSPGDAQPTAFAQRTPSTDNTFAEPS